MSELMQVPDTLDHETLVAVLTDVLERVRAGDSFEGSITWATPEDPAAPAWAFDVMASYRIGNLQGQGGMRVIGSWRERPNSPE